MEKITEAQVIRIDTKATGARIRELRKKHNLRVEDIRAYINLSDTQAIYKWQRGATLPSIENLLALSRLFNTTIEDIIQELGEEDKSSPSVILWTYLKHPEVVQKVLMEVQEKHLVMEGIEVILREISERTIREEGINNAVICQYTT